MEHAAVTSLKQMFVIVYVLKTLWMNLDTYTMYLKALIYIITSNF